MGRGHTKSVRAATTLALAVTLACGVTAPAARAALQPIDVVHQYLRALNRHDGAGVCRTFTTRLRTFEVSRDTPMSGPHTCAATVKAHFHGYYSAHRWVSAKIIGVLGTLFDAARGIALVRLTLAHRYICVGRGPVDGPCHAGVERRPDYMWLVRTGSSWGIIKPGLVYRASEIDHAVDDESIFYPPGDAATIGTPVTIPAPSFRCPASRATVADKTGDVENFGNPSPIRVNAPWLDVRRLSVSRIDRHVLCFTLTLGAAPRADSTYGIDVIHELKGGIEEGMNFDLTIDGVGGLHPELGNAGGLETPSISRSLPRIGMVGNRLEFAVAEPRHFTSGIALNVDAATGSIEPDEPLLAHPLDAGDLIVPDIGCLKFPSGGITRAGVCGNEPGP